ncbi:MAG: peptide deformylase [Patescibacteria group bacterium]|nr:peptide deformylase [Patescibacteria group bacterium]
MANLLQVAQLGSPVLRKKAKAVNDFLDSNTQRLIDDLIATVKEANGVGIAAPQVYESKKIFILASHPNARYPNAPLMKPTAIINPKIISHGREVVKDWEGCLSIPGIRGLIPRFKSISAKYYDRKGKLVKRSFTDFIARIFQHEHDHLEGILFVDRVESNKDLISEKEYLKMMAKRK